MPIGTTLAGWLLGIVIVGGAAGATYFAVTTSGPFAKGSGEKSNQDEAGPPETPVPREIAVRTLALTPGPGLGPIVPAAIAVGRDGTIYLADFGARRIYVQRAGSQVQPLAGSGKEGVADGNALEAEFMGPAGLAVTDNGIVYVADAPAHRVRRIDSAGTVTTLAGGGPVGLGQGDLVDGRAALARFNLPAQIALDPGGNLLVADKDNGAIRRITPEGDVSTIAGPAGPKTANGNAPQGPVGLAIGPDGSVYFTDHRSNGVFRITPSGALEQILSSIPLPISGGTPLPGATLQLSFPSGVSVAPDGSLLVADTQANRILRLSPTGSLIQVVGDAVAGESDGVGTAARFRAPTQLLSTANGDVLVVDSGNGRLRALSGLKP